jgi:hypothetical protein
MPTREGAIEVNPTILIVAVVHLFERFRRPLFRTRPAINLRVLDERLELDDSASGVEEIRPASAHGAWHFDTSIVAPTQCPEALRDRFTCRVVIVAEYDGSPRLPEPVILPFVGYPRLICRRDDCHASCERRPLYRLPELPLIRDLVDFR